MLSRILERRYWLVVFLICVFAFAARIYKLGEIKSYVFDEVYHAITAKLIARNDPRAYEWWNPPIEKDTAVDWLHPPLAKYTQAAAMRVFGETPFGWRISSAIVGTLLILVIAEFSRMLFQDKRIAVLAAFLASLDGLLLTQSRIAMNDIHVATMILVTFFAYVWYRRHLASYFELSPAVRQSNFAQTSGRKITWTLCVVGICIGLAMASKWSGFFAFLTVWGFEVLMFFSEYARSFVSNRDWIRQIKVRLLLLGLLPFFVYVLSYSHMFLQGKTLICEGDAPLNTQCYCNQNSSWWVEGLTTITGGNPYWQTLESRGGCKRLISHFSELNHQIWWYQTSLTATHGYQSRPLEWFLNLRPVWFYVKYEDGKIGNIYAQGNPALFWLGDIAVAASVMMLLIWKAQSLQDLFLRKSKIATEISSTPKKSKLKKADQASSKDHVQVFLQKLQLSVAQMTDFSTERGQLFFVVICYFAVWLPWQFSPRIMFFYHYTPAVPLLAILLGYWLIKLSKEPKGKYIAATFVVIIAIVFVVFYPNWTGIPVTQKFADQVYFVIKSWK